MGLAVKLRRCVVVTVIVVLGPGPSALGAERRGEVVVPCVADRSRMLNDAITAGNGQPGTRWDIVLEPGCVYTITTPYGRMNALTAVSGDVRIASPGPSNAVIARGAADGTPHFRLLEVEMGGRLTLDRVSVRGGSFGSGGGVFNNFGTLTLNHSTVEANHAREFGGGIATNGERATTTLHHTTVRDNTAGFGGGGLFTNGGTTALTASQVIRNAALGGVGGGILSNGPLSTLHLDHTTVTENRAAETAGGILNGGTATASRSSVTGNLPNDCAGSPAPVPGCAD
ncbi:hypothetical protein ACFVIM_02485 [Streptomyces sp. NPDC057638]|uniref:hypothetical protein n=1 Tax=Streptomyces sp. NPDC057638 TaxID=3346190 RepID=UPI0036C67918